MPESYANYVKSSFQNNVNKINTTLSKIRNKDKNIDISDIYQHLVILERITTHNILLSDQQHAVQDYKALFTLYILRNWRGDSFKIGETNLATTEAQSIHPILASIINTRYPELDPNAIKQAIDPKYGELLRNLSDIKIQDADIPDGILRLDDGDVSSSQVNIELTAGAESAELFNRVSSTESEQESEQEPSFTLNTEPCSNLLETKGYQRALSKYISSLMANYEQEYNNLKQEYINDISQHRAINSNTLKKLDDLDKKLNGLLDEYPLTKELYDTAKNILDESLRINKLSKLKNAFDENLKYLENDDTVDKFKAELLTEDYKQELAFWENKPNKTDKENEYINNIKHSHAKYVAEAEKIKEAKKFKKRFNQRYSCDIITLIGEVKNFCKELNLKPTEYTLQQLFNKGELQVLLSLQKEYISKVVDGVTIQNPTIQAFKDSIQILNSPPLNNKTLMALYRQHNAIKREDEYDKQDDVEWYNKIKDSKTKNLYSKKQKEKINKIQEKIDSGIKKADDLANDIQKQTQKYEEAITKHNISADAATLKSLSTTQQGIRDKYAEQREVVNNTINDGIDKLEQVVNSKYSFFSDKKIQSKPKKLESRHASLQYQADIKLLSQLQEISDVNITSLNIMMGFEKILHSNQVDQFINKIFDNFTQCQKRLDKIKVVEFQKSINPADQNSDNSKITILEKLKTIRKSYEIFSKLHDTTRAITKIEDSSLRSAIQDNINGIADHISKNFKNTITNYLQETITSITKFLEENQDIEYIPSSYLKDAITVVGEITNTKAGDQLHKFIDQESLNTFNELKNKLDDFAIQKVNQFQQGNPEYLSELIDNEKELGNGQQDYVDVDKQPLNYKLTCQDILKMNLDKMRDVAISHIEEQITKEDKDTNTITKVNSFKTNSEIMSQIKDAFDIIHTIISPGTKFDDSFAEIDLATLINESGYIIKQALWFQDESQDQAQHPKNKIHGHILSTAVTTIRLYVSHLVKNNYHMNSNLSQDNIVKNQHVFNITHNDIENSTATYVAKSSNPLESIKHELLKEMSRKTLVSSETTMGSSVNNPKKPKKKVFIPRLFGKTTSQKEYKSRTNDKGSQTKEWKPTQPRNASFFKQFLGFFQNRNKEKKSDQVASSSSTEQKPQHPDRAVTLKTFLRRFFGKKKEPDLDQILPPQEALINALRDSELANALRPGSQDGEIDFDETGSEVSFDDVSRISDDASSLSSIDSSETSDDEQENYMNDELNVSPRHEINPNRSSRDQQEQPNSSLPNYQTTRDQDTRAWVEDQGLETPMPGREQVAYVEDSLRDDRTTRNPDTSSINDDRPAQRSPLTERQSRPIITNQESTAMDSEKENLISFKETKKTPQDNQWEQQKTHVLEQYKKSPITTTPREENHSAHTGAHSSQGGIDQINSATPNRSSRDQQEQPNSSLPNYQTTRDQDTGAWVEDQGLETQMPGREQVAYVDDSLRDDRTTRNSDTSSRNDDRSAHRSSLPEEQRRPGLFLSNGMPQLYKEPDLDQILPPQEALINALRDSELANALRPGSQDGEIDFDETGSEVSFDDVSRISDDASSLSSIDSSETSDDEQENYMNDELNVSPRHEINPNRSSRDQQEQPNSSLPNYQTTRDQDTRAWVEDQGLETPMPGREQVAYVEDSLRDDRTTRNPDTSSINDDRPAQRSPLTERQSRPIITNQESTAMDSEKENLISFKETKKTPQDNQWEQQKTHVLEQYKKSPITTTPREENHSAHTGAHSSQGGIDQINSATTDKLTPTPRQHTTPSIADPSTTNSISQNLQETTTPSATQSNGFTAAHIPQTSLSASQASETVKQQQEHRRQRSRSRGSSISSSSSGQTFFTAAHIPQTSLSASQASETVKQQQEHRRQRSRSQGSSISSSSSGQTL